MHAKSVRRANRYRERAFWYGCRLRYCSFALWLERSHAARRGFGPSHLRGKSANAIFRMIYGAF
jgi:hypothetical protein